MSMRTAGSQSLPWLFVFALTLGCGDDGTASVPDGGNDAGAPDAGSPDAARPEGGSLVDAGPTDGSVPDGADGATPDAGSEPGPACQAASAPPSTDPSAGAWSGRHYLAGADGPVSAVAVMPDGDILVAGEFSGAGRIEASNIVRWDGSAFAAMGEGLPRFVRDVAVDGSGAVWALMDTGFDPVSGTNGTALFRWDDPEWTEMAGTVESALTLAVGTDGNLLVGGAFTTIGGADVATLARWDGDSFVAVAEDVPDGPVEALLVDEDMLCVGGLFERIGDVRSPSVACLADGAWSARGLPRTGFGVSALARDADGSLVAGGHFTLDPEDRAGSVARWTGSGWELVGEGLILGPGAGYVATMIEVGGTLFVAGRFERAGSINVTDVAAWDGTSWDAVNGGLTKTAFGVGLDSVNVADAVLSEGSVYFGGQFSIAGEVTALGVARFDGVRWRSLRSTDADYLGGLNGNVFSLATLGDCGLYVGGNFASAGDIPARNVARLDAETGWEALGDGLLDPVQALQVAMSRGPDETEGVLGGFGGSEPLVFAGLDGDTQGDLGHVAVWNGLSWARVGQGLDGTVWTFAVDGLGQLWAGGDFTILGRGGRALHVAYWDGTRWNAAGDGLDGSVRTLVFGPDGTLHAGGQFDGAIARWDGATWSTVGDGFEDGSTVQELAFHEDTLYVAGWFDRTGDGSDARNVVRFDGATFEELGLLDGIFASDMAWVGDHLYVAGIFDRLDAEPGTQILAVWDGESWGSLSGDASDLVEDLTYFGDSLWIGGSFTGAGSEVSFGIGAYDLR